MEERKIGLQAALQWISDLHDALADEFLEAYKKLPSSIHPDVAAYADGLGNWVRGNDTWSFEVFGPLPSLDYYLIHYAPQSERYFGKRGLEIQNGRVVELLPKEIGKPGNTGLIPKAQGVSVSKPESSWLTSYQLLKIWIMWGITLLLLILLYPSLRDGTTLLRYESRYI